MAQNTKHNRLGLSSMSLLFVVTFITVLIAGMQLTWPGRYRG